MSINIQTSDGLKTIADKTSKEKIISVLGYLPANHANLESHTINTSNPHNVTASQVGLGNVDNTSDVDKPVSTAQQAAINSAKNSLKSQIDDNMGEMRELIITHTHDNLQSQINEKANATDIPDYITTGAREGTTVGLYATAEGIFTDASGNYSHAEGYNTTTSGDGSHAEGYNTNASGNYSHAEGTNTNANGICSHAGGYGTIANDYQYVVGRYNANTTAPTSLSDTTESAGLFIVGIGTSDSALSNGFRINPAGKVYGTGTFGTSGADYAEYFEWFDGNPNNEDRRGRFVTLDGGKIRYATSNDDYILGVVSSNPSVAGDIQSENWHDMYLKDIYGSKIVKVIEVEETTSVDGKVIPAHTEKRWVLNPDYNPNVEYTSREERPEWAAIGIVGKLVVVDDGTCQANSYCYPNANGIATASQEKTNYRVMERLDDNHIRVFIR